MPNRWPVHVDMRAMETIRAYAEKHGTKITEAADRLIAVGANRVAVLAGEPWRIEARLRFAMRDHKPVFSYALVDAAGLLRAAFAEVREKVTEATTLPVWAGAPE